MITIRNYLFRWRRLGFLYDVHKTEHSQANKIVQMAAVKRRKKPRIPRKITRPRIIVKNNSNENWKETSDKYAYQLQYDFSDIIS